MMQCRRVQAQYDNRRNRLTGPLEATHLFLCTTVTSRMRKACMQYTLRASITQTQISQVKALSQCDSKYHQRTFFRTHRPLICDGGGFLGGKNSCLVSLFSRTTALLGAFQTLASVSMRKVRLLNIFLC